MNTTRVATAGTHRTATFEIAALLSPGLAAGPERAAVIVEGAATDTRTSAYTSTYTYGDLDRGVGRVVGALRRDGVRPGDRLAFLADDPVRYLTVLVATARLGAVSIPVNHRLSPGEVAGILTDSGASLLVTTGAVLDGLAALPGAQTRVARVVLLDGSAGPPAGMAGAEVTDWDAWLDGVGPAVGPTAGPTAGTDGADAADLRDREAAPAVVQMYTSGTTGRPKGVLLADANLAVTIPEMCDLWLLDGSSRMLGVLPLFHIAGLGASLGTLWSASTLVIPRALSPDVLVDTVVDHGVTNLVLASVLLQRMIEEASKRVAQGSPPDLSSLRVVGYGAAPISQHVLRDALALLPCGLLQVYGLTETAGTISVLRPDDHDLAAPERLRSCGRPLDSLELRITDPLTGQDRSPGEVGEIRVRSARVTSGYWQAPAATAEAITSDGWLRTGDLGYRDDAGLLYLCDRLRDMIITGGENVYPAEIEDVLHGHPGVAEAAVVGVPDPRWGETPKAVVVARPGYRIDDAELLSFTRDRLAHFKCPTSVEVVDALPRNATGKVLRRVLREPYWSGSTRLVN